MCFAYKSGHLRSRNDIRNRQIYVALAYLFIALGRVITIFGNGITFSGEVPGATSGEQAGTGRDFFCSPARPEEKAKTFRRCQKRNLLEPIFK